MRKILFLLLFIPTITFSFECNETDINNAKIKIEEIFNNIIISIGNKSLLEPELKFSKDEKRGAYLSQESITFEEKVITLFCGDKNFEEKVAFILAHELAHYYLQHGWMIDTGLSFANDVGKELKYRSYSYEEVKEAEAQADIYAGFYGLISGYNVLEHAEIAMNKVYESYNFPRITRGYPSYDDRVKIINDKKAQAQVLSNIFEIANALLKFGKYYEAKEFYETILKNKFNSREIYNNLGLSYLMYAISVLDDDKAKLLFPVYLDEQTRLDLKKTRSSFTGSPEKMIKKAQNYFERSNDLDPNYFPSKQNKFVSQFLLANSNPEREKVLEQIELDSNLDDQVKYDFKVINAILNNVKLKKIKKIAKKGSYISEFNTSEESTNLVEETLNQDDILDILKIKEDIINYELFGNPKRISSKNLTYFYSVINNIDFYEINDKTYLFKIPEKIYNQSFKESQKDLFKITSSGIYYLYTMK